jgi:hypothetical protein
MILHQLWWNETEAEILFLWNPSFVNILEKFLGPKTNGFQNILIPNFMNILEVSRSDCFWKSISASVSFHHSWCKIISTTFTGYRSYVWLIFHFNCCMSAIVLMYGWYFILIVACQLFSTLVNILKDLRTHYYWEKEISTIHKNDSWHGTIKMKYQPYIRTIADMQQLNVLMYGWYFILIVACQLSFLCMVDISF